MAMVRPLTEGDMINGNTPEDESHSSDQMEGSNSRPHSRSSSGSKRASPAFMPSLQYSKEELMKYSSCSISQSWPSCLDPAYNNPSGKWDPERWFMNHRSDRVPSLDEPPSRSKRERQDDSGILSHKRKTSDPKERIKEEKDDIVLSPQRRSFGTGCHVSQSQSSLARRPGSPCDGRDGDSYRESRRIGSGRIMARDRDQRDWDRDREYGYGGGRSDRRDRFDQDDVEKDNRRYSNRYNRRDRRTTGRERIDEVEPEWFSGGPTSQSETIELVGFEDPHEESRKPAKKNSAKRAKQNSRRSSLKSDEGERLNDAILQEDGASTKKDNLSEDDAKSKHDKMEDEDMAEPKKTSATGFDLDDLLRMDWPELMPTEAPQDATNEIGGSRFSQWFRRESPLLGMHESRNDSRRSSLHEELIANVLNSIGEPQLLIPSPTHSSSDNFFTPISPDVSHAVSCNSASKNIMDMLHSAADMSINGEDSKDSAKAVKEMEENLKRIVLGEAKPNEERSAFDKLVQHMSDSRNSPATSISIGPLDKSKALQEEDILQDMLGATEPPMMPPFQMFKEEKPAPQVTPGIPRPQYLTPNQPSSTSDMFAHLLQQQKQQQEQQMLHQQQQQLQNHLQQQQQQQQQSQGIGGGQGFTFDVLAKILGTSTQPPLSPASSGMQHAPSGIGQNDPQVLNSILQFQRQRELLATMLKQQQQQQQQPAAQSLLQQQAQQQRRCPSSKEMPLPQTLGLPALALSPRQSPLPPEAMGSGIPSQGRIASPLVFSQQPPALSHAPAPIHPTALAQAIAQNAANPNTLQVQNPIGLQRVPSPQELAVHTQSILQNALIKRKLEEQKENFRKRQEAQRSGSPVSSSKNGVATSPMKGLSPPIAFTPSSVMRKMQSEKVENKEQNASMQQNGSNKGIDARASEAAKNIQKLTSTGAPASGIESSFGLNHLSPSQSGPRSIHGGQLQAPLGTQQQQQRPMPAGTPSIVIPGQGRPIVKVGLGQCGGDLARSGMVGNKPGVAHNKSFLPNNNQTHGLHEVDPNFDAMAKLSWQHQFGNRQQNTSAIPQLHSAAAAYAALGHRPTTAVNPHGNPNLFRPVNVGSSTPASNLNFPLLRNIIQNPAIRAQTNTLNQLAALQLRGALDPRQIQALAQSQRVHPVTLQQLLMNAAPNQVAAQAQVGAGFSTNRDAKHHLLPGQSSANRQSPVNLAKWFGNDVLKQKMPEMPPMSQEKALLVEEVERQQQQSTVVHN